MRRAIAGQQVFFAQAMISNGVGKAADDGVILHALGQFRQVLANVNAGHGGGDWFKLAAITCRRVGLQIKGVLMGRAALEENENG